MAQDKICQPKEVDGFRIHNIKLQAQALGAELIWRMICNLELSWIRTLSNKYLKSMDPLSILRTKSPPQVSGVQNFMLKCRYIIFNKVTRQVANGMQVKFWIDSQEGFPPLCKISKIAQAMSILTKALGTFLKDYWEEDPSTSKGWRWKYFKNFNIPLEELAIIENILSIRSFSLSSSKDMLVWF